LEQEPAHRAGKICLRLKKGTFVGDQTRTVGLDETPCLNLDWFMTVRIVRVGMDRSEPSSVAQPITVQEGATMHSDPRKTWQYFAHAVIREDDPAKLTYLMQELYRVLKDNREEPSLA